MEIGHDQESPGNVTRVLAELRSGTPGASERLWDLVYARLRALAARHRLPSGDLVHRTTDIAHAAFEALARQSQVEWQDRAHFFAVASLAMRRTVVDWARAAGRRAVASGRSVDELEVAAARGPDPADLVDLDDALTALERHEPRCARVVEMRYFGGLPFAEIAEALGVSERTAAGDWTFARAWLFRRLSR
jgi:RNA polymerase sigma factor (TIGR02999 family)